MGIIYPSSMLSKPRGLVASGFDPISAFGSDLALWLDPSYGVYTDRSTQLTAASSQYWSVAHNSSLRFTTAMSLSFWVYRDTDANDQCFLGKWTYNTDGGWGIQSTSDGVGNTGIRVFLATSAADDGTGCSIEFAAAGVTHAAWHHVCLIFDGTLTGNANRAKLYVDGVQKTLAMNAGAVPASLVADTADLNIGKFGGALLRYMNGRMDSVRIWGRAISATDVASEYNAGAGKVYADLTAAEQVSLVSAFDFDGDGLDSHGSNDLTAVNSPTYTTGIASGLAGDGDLVSLIVPRVGPNLVPPSYAKRTVWYAGGGRPYFQSPASWGYDLASTIAQNATAWQLFAVYERHATTDASSPLFLQRNVTVDEPGLYLVAGKPQSWSGGGEYWPDTADTLAAGSKSILMWAQDSAKYYSRVGAGTLREKADTSLRSVWTSVGEHTYSAEPHGKLYDLLLFNSILSTAEETQLRNWLAAKNGVTL